MRVLLISCCPVTCTASCAEAQSNAEDDFCFGSASPPCPLAADALREPDPLAHRRRAADRDAQHFVGLRLCPGPPPADRRLAQELTRRAPALRREQAHDDRERCHEELDIAGAAEAVIGI
jgi:hypothetical protein